MAPSASKRRQLNAELVDVAAAGRHRDVARLLEERADIEAVDRSGYTALSEAAMAGHTVVVGQLLRAWADPDHAAEDGRTSLHRAAFFGWAPVIKLLLENGADPHLKDKSGSTPADLAKSRAAKELITGFPEEQRLEAAKERRKQIAALPPPEPEPAEEEPAAGDATADGGNTEAPPAAEEANSTAQRGLAFNPPPRRSGAAEPEAEPAVAEGAGEDAGSKRKKGYEKAIEELKAQFGEDTVGDDVPASQAQPPLTARVEVRGAAEERLNGSYLVRCAYKDRVEFEKEGDRQCQIFWSEWHDEWRMLIGDFKLGSTLYRHKYRPNWKADEHHGVPKEGWQKWFGRDPAPTVVYLGPADETPSQPSGEAAEESAEAAPAAEPSAEGAAAPSAAGALATEGKKAEFMEIHSPLEIIKKDERAAQLQEGAGGSQPRSRQFEVSLVGGERVIETAEGLFGVGEVVEASDSTMPAVQEAEDPTEKAAKAWLESIGGAPEVPATWEAVHAAKTAASELFSEGKVGDSRQATSAALGVARRLLEKGANSIDGRCGMVIESVDEDDAEGDREEQPYRPTIAEVDALIGVLYSNRSLLLVQQIQAGDAQALAFGPDAAWRLVLADTDAALRKDATNFKASFRRARALFELGDLEGAMADATRVVDHYARTSATPNPEAAGLRDRILDALRKERKKWAEKGPARWNRAAAQDAPLITELGGADESSATAASKSSRQNPNGASSGGAPAAVVQRLAAAPPRAPVAPRTGGDVEKAILSTLKGDAARQLAYVKEHVSAAALRRFYRRAPLGPDLLGALVRLLANLAEEDAKLAGDLLGAIAAAPSSRTQAGMFDAEERAALDSLLSRVGPDAAGVWEGRPESGGA